MRIKIIIFSLLILTSFIVMSENNVRGQIENQLDEIEIFMMEILLNVKEEYRDDPEQEEKITEYVIEVFKKCKTISDSKYNINKFKECLLFESQKSLYGDPISIHIESGIEIITIDDYRVTFWKLIEKNGIEITREFYEEVERMLKKCDTLTDAKGLVSEKFKECFLDEINEQRQGILSEQISNDIKSVKFEQEKSTILAILSVALAILSVVLFFKYKGKRNKN